MGHLTTFTVHNDSCHEIPEHAQEFADAIYAACQNHKSSTIHIGDTKCQRVYHANDTVFFVSAGNSFFEMNYFNQETIDLMKINPEFFKEILDNMAYHLRELKKEFVAANPRPEKISRNKWEKIMDGTTAIYYLSKKVSPLWYCKVFRVGHGWTFAFGQRDGTPNEEKDIVGEKTERYNSTKTWKTPEAAKAKAIEVLRNHLIKI